MAVIAALKKVYRRGFRKPDISTLNYPFCQTRLRHKMVYSTSNAANGWDGNFKGSKQP
jgi:hypothetical protein